MQANTIAYSDPDPGSDPNWGTISRSRHTNIHGDRRLGSIEQHCQEETIPWETEVLQAKIKSVSSSLRPN